MALRAVSTIGATGGATGTLPVFINGYPNVSLTGSVTETNLAAIRIPANSIGPQGALRISVLFTCTNSANNKTVTLRFTAASGAISGGQLVTSAVTTSGQLHGQITVRNANATNSQVVYAFLLAPFGSSATAPASTAVDTTADSFLNINGTLALGTETLTLLGYTVEIFHA